MSLVNTLHGPAWNCTAPSFSHFSILFLYSIVYVQFMLLYLQYLLSLILYFLVWTHCYAPKHQGILCMWKPTWQQTWFWLFHWGLLTHLCLTINILANRMICSYTTAVKHILHTLYRMFTLDCSWKSFTANIFHLFTPNIHTRWLMCRYGTFQLYLWATISGWE